MGMDLRAPKQRFATLMEDIGPTATSQFVVWLDEKVAEFKVNGNMNFDINIDAPRWIRDYSMSVMLSTAAQQYSEKESESEYSRTAERPTPTARRKDPVPQPRPRPRLSRPQSPQLSPAPSESSFGGLSRFSDEQTERGHKRLHQEIDNSVVPRQREFMDIKRERRDDSCQFEQDVDGSSINGAGDGSAGDIVKSEPLSPSHQSYELDDRPHVSDTLRDNTDQNDPQSEVVQTIFTPGASQLVATAASTSSSLQGASGDDSFQEAILLDDSDDSREGNPDDFMRKIIAYESQHNPDDDSMLQESMDEGVAGPSGQGSEIIVRRVSDSPDDYQDSEMVPYVCVQAPIPVADTPFVCVYCGKTEELLKEFNVHLQGHATQHRLPDVERPGYYLYTCPVCSRVIRSGSSRNFVRHLLCHFPATRSFYACDLCNKSFPRQDHLKAHKRRVHGFI